MPNRNELSGGAFIVSTSIFKSCSFPSWFDEDWFWFDKIRTIASTNQDNTNIKILHNSDKKVILDLDCLKFEEDGKILTNSLKNGNKAIQESVNKQIDFVLYKLNYIQETLWNIKSKNGTDERIQYHLKQLYEYIKNKNASYYISEIDKFNYFNNNWITEFDKTVELLKNNR